MDDDVELVELIVSHRSRLRRYRDRRRRSHVVAAVVIVCASALAVAALAFTGGAVVFSSCSLAALHPVALGQNSFVYAKDGSLLGSLPSARTASR